jgi:hypothetical protein
MIIHRISGQKRKTFLEFYTPYDGQIERAHVALNGMKALLQHLFEMEGPELYAFTSHYHMCFVNGDSHTYPIIARIAPGCTGDDANGYSPLFHIGYPPTPDVLRDETRWIHESFSDCERAGEFLLQSFRESAFSPFD